MHGWVELSSQGIQALAVVIIVISIIYGTARFILQLWARGADDTYRAYKKLLGRSLLLSLEFLVAADVIRTVLLDLTAKGMEILGALVVVRTFLSWSLVLEIEGHWPWSPAPVTAPTEKVAGDDARNRLLPSKERLDNSSGWAAQVSVPAAGSDESTSRTAQWRESQP